MSIELDDMRGNWSFPTNVRFGVGRIAELPQACRELGIARPLVVTDKGLAPLAMLKDSVAALSDAGLGAAMFCDVQGNPIEANVDAGLQAYGDGDHDGVVAFGGGSAMDVGKCIALMVGQSRPIWDFEDREDWYTRANADGIAPVIAVPTTSGTGSEVGRAGVITNLEDHTKRIIFHPKMLPAIVIEDPQVTAGLPAHLTAAVGMDALSHNMEAYCSPLFHPMADGIALEGMRLIKDWLPAACADGNDLEARGNMQVASSMGATAFQKGLGAMHALAHPIGGLLDRHHGLTIAIVMPYVLATNRPAIEQPIARLAGVLGLPQADFDGMLGWVLKLRSDLGIPHDLGALGVAEEHVAVLAPRAANDPSAGGNPRTLDAAGYAALYRRALTGALLAAP